jgi:multidrug efflux pump subunit AcrB
MVMPPPAQRLILPRAEECSGSGVAVEAQRLQTLAIAGDGRGFFITAIQLPLGSSAARTEALLNEVSARVLPISGIKTSIGFSGVDGPSETRTASSSAAFFMLDGYDLHASV